MTKQIRLWKNSQSKLQAFSLLGKYGTIFALIIIIIIFSVLQPGVFLTMNNLLNILNQIALLSIISAGLTVVMVMGEFDLSIGTLASFAGCLVVGMVMRFGLVPGIIIGLISCFLIGLLNGVIVNLLNASAFIVTIAMSSVITGLIFWYTGGSTIFGDIPESFLSLARGNFILGVTNMVIIMLLVMLILWILLEQTALGRQMYVVGGNPTAARYSGVNIAKCKMIGFIICSICAGISGILLASRIGAGHPTAGESYLLKSFTAVFLGSATLKGGRFHILGTLIGALFIGVITNGLTILNVQYYVQNIFEGLILIFAISVSGVSRKVSV